MPTAVPGRPRCPGRFIVPASRAGVSCRREDGAIGRLRVSACAWPTSPLPGAFKGDLRSVNSFAPGDYIDSWWRTRSSVSQYRSTCSPLEYHGRLDLQHVVIDAVRERDDSLLLHQLGDHEGLRRRRLLRHTVLNQLHSEVQPLCPYVADDLVTVLNIPSALARESPAQSVTA